MRNVFLAMISMVWILVAAARAGTIPASTDLEFLQFTESMLAEADARPATDSERGSARMTALQLLATARANVGDHAGAAQAYAESFYATDARPLPAATDLKPDDLEFARSMLARYRPTPAIGAIVAAARNRQIVILNESHQLSQHRSFALQVARALRRLGFRYLAVETLEPGHTQELASRGYPLRDDGWYVKDPVFGDFIRQSLHLGFRPVAYEWEAPPPTPGNDWRARINAREEAQADNLIARVLKQEPKAKIFVYVGFSHALKGSEISDDRELIWMAERLKRKTGIDPLSIDETHLKAPLPGTRDRALLDAIFAATAARSVVLVERSHPKTNYLYDPARIDLQVFHRPAQIVAGREDWLSMDGYRKPRPIPAELLPLHGRRLIQAFVAGEAPGAVPMDQVLVTAGQSAPALMLPGGKYRFAFQE